MKLTTITDGDRYKLLIEIWRNSETRLCQVTTDSNDATSLLELLRQHYPGWAIVHMRECPEITLPS